jgi:glycosyltransferase involved in cell wall biosynthesis
MPNFFKGPEIDARNRGYSRYANWSSTVILSSADAQADLAKFAPAAVPNSRVLHFVASLTDSNMDRGREFLVSTYGIDSLYFYLPNQFWKHKNHRVVIDALGELVKQGRAPLVVCTGKTDDRRSPEYFQELMDHCNAVGAAPFFKVLGLVAYQNLGVLMKHAVAVINPSQFEGWSTTVEESKSMGKLIILSDIPVHREQAPEYGVFFPPTDANALAEKMADTMANWSELQDIQNMAAARLVLAERTREFGRTYQSIVAETVARHRSG